MRTLFRTTCFLLLFTTVLHAQTANSGDCRTAIPVCADAPIMITVDGRGAVDDFDPEVIRQTGCLEKGSIASANVENNTSWLVFRAGTGGQVGFDIEALPSVGSTVTAEWDFAVYGPDVDCADISNGTAQPIRCNYEPGDTNFTGLGVNPVNGQPGAPPLVQNQNTYDEYLDVQPGEIYYILINNYNTNFDNQAEDFMLTFTGSSVEADQDSALDCTLRDEFLGLDITACEGDPDILLSALRSPAGPDVASIVWSVDYDDDGTIDDTNLPGIGVNGGELIVSSPNTGRYFAEITTLSGTPPTVSDVGGVFIEFFGPPEFAGVDILDTNLSIDPDINNVEILVNGNSEYEYALNGGEFQDEAVFNDIPPGMNTVIINDKNGCGTTEEEFLMVAYPKFFTPNGDGVNETWNIRGIETLGSPVVFIFDRYGKLLKQLDATSAWDGTFNGRRMPSSDYWFRFEYDDSVDNVVVAKTRKTHFTLKR